MLTVALQTIRVRWAAFVGTFVALTLGAGMIAAMGLEIGATLGLPERAPQRFATAPVVVAALDPEWDPARHDPGSRSLIQARGISDGLAAQVGALGRTVPVRSFYAQLAGGETDQVGHGWSTAQFAPYGLAAGRGPEADTEVVVPAGGAGPGERVTVFTAAGPKDYTVAGVTVPVGFESAVFFTEVEAARLSPRVEALVAYGAPEAVRQAVGGDAEVLTGDRRNVLDPSYNADREAIDNTRTLLPITAVVAGFVSIFLVASTFAFAVAQRRREIALLRTVGATPRQVRRMVVSEATVVGIASAVAGCALGLGTAPPLAGWMVDLGLAPSWFTAPVGTGPAVWVPLLIAFCMGLGVALAGVWAASRRAGDVRPIEALRDAAVDFRTMTSGRWLYGLLALAFGFVTIGWVAAVNPGMVMVPTRYIGVLMFPILAFALLAPVVVKPIARLVTWPLGRFGGAAGMLVRSSALTAVRRTAATAAPVLLTVGLSISLLGAAATIDRAKDSGRRNQVTADFVVTPDGTPGVNEAVTERVRAIPGVDVVAALPTMVYAKDDARLADYEAQTVDPAALSRTLTLPVAEGSATELRDDTIIVNEDWGVGVGDTVEVFLADGTIAPLRVVAVLSTTSGSNDVAYLSNRYAVTARYAFTGLAQRVYVSLRPGTDPAAVRTALDSATAGLGARVVPAGDWLGEESAENSETTALGMLLVLGIAIVFCFIAIVNTLVMATSDRLRDLAILRLAGATPRQVLRVFAGESLLVVGVGVLLAVGASAVNLAGLRLALGQLVGATPVTVPWGTVVLITAVSAVLAVLGAVVPVRLAFRSRAVELAGVRE
ncbi:FtsX-like permease family protein [Plantactinospora solaniradicis]|uniref:FtsX-like permease family protein n=1 Tax=Plantactinospora solaniradicis TaxID=1723736 RepID=A0ABW1KGT0_9ACTN